MPLSCQIHNPVLHEMIQLQQLFHLAIHECLVLVMQLLLPVQALPFETICHGRNMLIFAVTDLHISTCLLKKGTGALSSGN